MYCGTLGIFLIIIIEASALHSRSTSHCDYNNQSFQIVCNGESYISSQCFEKMEEVQLSIKHLKFVECKTPILESKNVLSYFDVIDIFESPIEILDLSFNCVGNLNATAFDRFKNLQYLDLSYTNLTSFTPDVFFQLDKLKFLNLSHNFLSTLDFGSKIFEQMHTLHLDFNQLSDIDAITRVEFPSLMTISITNNKLNCSYLEKLLSKWINLSIVATCKSKTSHEIQPITEAFDTVRETTELFDVIWPTIDAFEAKLSTQSDEDFEEMTEHFEHTEKLDDAEIPLNETSSSEITTEIMETSTLEMLTEEPFTKFDIFTENFITEKNEMSDMKNEASEPIASTDFWLQLQIIQFVLIIFGILYLVVNAIQRIIEEDKLRNNDYDKEPQDEFQTIELNSQEFAM